MSTRGILRAEEGRLRRLKWLALGGGMLWLGLVSRLVQVQGVEHQAYLAKAQEQHQRRLELKGDRGRILDRQGRVLGVDVEAVSFFAHPDQVEEPEAVAAHFAPLDAKRAQRLERQLRGDGPFVYLARQLDGGALARAESRSFAGVFRHSETKRHYPQGRLAGQLLGYTNIDNKGSEGVELAFEELMRGTKGTALVAVDALGKQVPGSRRERQKAEDGDSVVLTIDAVYQDILEQELERAIQNSEAEGGMGIISDPRTGEILAMANLPLYDPNRPASVEAKWRRNRAVTDPYEPGSTFKVVAAAAVIEEGLGNFGELIFCEEGSLKLDNGDLIRDIHPHGLLSFGEVMEKSSNIGTIKIARRLSRARFYEYIRRFGFAGRTGIGLPGESTGLLEEVGKWSDRSQETIAIGQEISVTGLQLVRAFGVIANDGQLMEPHIVKGILHGDGQVEERARLNSVRQVISAGTAERVRKMLTGVVANGTGKRAQIEGVAVAGKTGTAQQASRNGGGYDPDRNIVSFVGFLPAEDPELLCLIVVDNPLRDRWGGHTAAPAFKRVMERILYLPEGRACARQSGEIARRQENRGDDPLESIPDLRGMSRRVARFQAGLRGLPVTFSGEGEVVLEQQPPPGDCDIELVHITCVLGNADELGEAQMEGALMRQALLLQTLSQSRSSQDNQKL